MKKKSQKVQDVEIDYSKKLKRFDESWDFKGVNTKEYTHCFHVYPAMMIPQVARRLINEFGKNAKILLDPYCGTGTSLVEANLFGINAIGIDINKLACLIAKVKTTRLDIETLDNIINEFNNYAFTLRFNPINHTSLRLPKVTNLDFWFSKNSQIKLLLILNFINSIRDQDISDFFKVAFSETVREVSYVRLNEFKLVRKKNLSNKYNPDVFSIFSSKLQRNRNGLIEFLIDVRSDVFTKVYNFNAINEFPRVYFGYQSVDLVVTSPPYGDSKTTVAYGQFSRLPAQWLEIENASEIDKLSMGGQRVKNLQKFNCEILNETIKQIYKEDHKRALDVVSFYIDYEKSIYNVSQVVKRKGFVCYVVGNRTVKGIQIPNDEITKQMFEKLGFEHIETIVRNIPNKRMPLKNSPSNISGETSDTMRNEFIIILQKK
ncbi:MAG: TRM11 family SAM-dependent methyltransferase [Ignavibacteria bacterium]